MMGTSLNRSLTIAVCALGVLLLPGCDAIYTLGAFKKICASNAGINIRDSEKWQQYLSELRGVHIADASGSEALRVSSLPNFRMRSSISDLNGDVPRNTPIHNIINISTSRGEAVATINSYYVSFQGLASRNSYDCARDFPEFYSDLNQGAGR